MSDKRAERLEAFKRRVDADLAPFRNLMDELRAESDDLIARLDAEAHQALEGQS